MPEINLVTLENSAHERMDLSLLFYGKEQCDPGHFWGPGLRNSYIIHYVHGGRGRYTTGERTYELRAGDGFVILPNTLVHYKADDADPWTYSWIGFKGFSVRPYLQRAGLSQQAPVFRAGPGSRFETFHDELMQTQEVVRTADIHSHIVLYRLMAELIDCSGLPEPADKLSGSKKHYIAGAIEYIENHYSQKLAVLDIARHVGLDRTYLSGLFKEELGLSLQAFLVQYRMNRAQELLRHKELSVSDVSRSVGYNDPFLFSKMFKKVTGSSPRAARSAQESP